MLMNVFVLLYTLSDNSIYKQLSIMKWWLIKMQIKHAKLVFYKFYFFIKVNFFYVYNFIINNFIHSTCKMFSIFTITCSRIPNIIFFTYMMLFTLTSTFIVIPPFIWLSFWLSNLHLHPHDICFVNAFDSFIPIDLFKNA